jgi:hypothetical protein
VSAVEQCAGVDGVPDGGRVADAEARGEVRRVAAGGQGLFELAANAQSFDGCWQVPQVQDPPAPPARECCTR